MNRDTAKILSQLSDEQLGEIRPEYKDYVDVIRAFADGAEIECRNAEDKSWKHTSYLDFESMDYFRVAPDLGSNKGWRPKESGERYFYVGFKDPLSEDWFAFEAVDENFRDDEWEHELFKRNNCFKTENEAEAVAKKLNEAMEAILSGKSVDGNASDSAVYVESVDGEALTDGEKDLIRALRNVPLIVSVKDTSDDDISFRTAGLLENKETARDAIKKISNEKLLKVVVKM